MLKRILFVSIVLACLLTACAGGASPAQTSTESESATTGNVTADDTCLIGTWRADPAEYVVHMTTINDISSVTFTNMDKPLYYIFAEDGTLTIWFDNGVITEEISASSGTPDIMTITMEAAIVGLFNPVDPATAAEYDGWFKFAEDVISTLRVTSVKQNGQEIITTGVRMENLIDLDEYTAVGWDCEGDTLTLFPIIPNKPESSFTLVRDTTWTPPN